MIVLTRKRISDYFQFQVIENRINREMKNLEKEKISNIIGHLII